MKNEKLKKFCEFEEGDITLLKVFNQSDVNLRKIAKFFELFKGGTESNRRLGNLLISW